VPTKCPSLKAVAGTAWDFCNLRPAGRSYNAVGVALVCCLVAIRLGIGEQPPAFCRASRPPRRPIHLGRSAAPPCDPLSGGGGVGKLLAKATAVAGAFRGDVQAMPTHCPVAPLATAEDAGGHSPGHVILRVGTLPSSPVTWRSARYRLPSVSSPTSTSTIPQRTPLWRSS
jgi:hypothetical protein